MLGRSPKACSKIDCNDLECQINFFLAPIELENATLLKEEHSVTEQ